MILFFLKISLHLKYISPSLILIKFFPVNIIIKLNFNLFYSLSKSLISTYKSDNSHVAASININVTKAIVKFVSIIQN